MMRLNLGLTKRLIFFSRNICNLDYISNALKTFSKIDPENISGKNPGKMYNLINGEWTTTKKYTEVIDPMNGENFLLMPDTSVEELNPLAECMKTCPKAGLHNPLKNPERYLLYGSICQKAASLLYHEPIFDHFVKLLIRTMPKSEAQAKGEIKTVRAFIENFAGDNVRFLAQSIQYPGDYNGQRATSYRWPYGPVAIISPFNFPIEIPALQFMGALFMGNKAIIKPHTKTSAIVEEFLRFLIYCGMPPTDINMIHSFGGVFEQIYDKCDIRMTQFTGSSFVA